MHSPAPDAPTPYADATTPDRLIENLVRAHGDRRHAEYERLLHDAFTFYFAPEDVAAGTDERFDRAQDLASTLAMFTGQAGERIDGGALSPIGGMLLRLVPESASWVEAGQDLAGTLVRRYWADLTLEYADDGERTPASAVGLQEFYVVEVPRGEGAGVSTSAYQLKFWRDFGSDGLKEPLGPKGPLGPKAPDIVSWGRIKASY